MINKKIPELEVKVLRILWELDRPSTVQEIIDFWKESDKPGYTTILKKLQVMEGKGLIDHKRVGRAYSYFPLIEKTQVSKSKFNGLLNNLFGGDKLEMAASFIKETELSESELDKLLTMIKNREKNE